MRVLLWVSVLFFMAGCQSLTASKQKNSAIEIKSVRPTQQDLPEINWSALYLEYKAMTVDELEQSLLQLQAAPVTKESAIRQVFIYLTPHSPVKNSHMGRTLLRRWLSDYPEEATGQWQLLMDTLTETTRLSERLQKNTETHQSLLQQLEQGKVQLQQQIEQLKSIEQHINDRDNRTNGK